MAIERERKFLVKDLSFLKDAVETRYIKQGYIAVSNTHEVRVSVRNENSFICVKTVNSELEREEYDYNISDDDANKLFNKCEKVLYKTRYIIPCNSYLKWEVDIFHGKNDGLILAELELPRGWEFPDIPSWLGEEVTGNPDYYNKNIAKSR